MSQYESINIEDISDIGAIVPDGTYTWRLQSVEGKSSKAGNPMVVATFEVAEGEHEGLTTTKFLVLIGKAGKPNMPGLSDFKKILLNSGRAGKNLAIPLDPDAAAKLLERTLTTTAKYVGEKGTDVNKKDGKKYQRFTLVGPKTNIIETGVGEFEDLDDSKEWETVGGVDY